MTCPRCQSSRVRHTSSATRLNLAVWRCTECGTQFTTQTDREAQPARLAAGKRLILNVDDRPPALYARNRMLRAKGFAVADAATGIAAWEAAMELRPHAILLDVHLPDADGCLLCRQMRDDRQLGGIPIVLISATLREHEAPDLAECGAVSFLREPVAADVLAATLRRALAG
jgi:CheY-like chemotaxis protein